ncbi:MAG: 30S ribosomal protein S18 [Elusimicrobiota bacterium]|nr:30S ribosomal protein S18 [Elusimicrobiota bacterium]
MAFTKKRTGTKPPAAGEGAGRQGGGKFKKPGFVKKKICRFCADKLEIDYKNLSMLRAFVTDGGKILSGRITGSCAKHQRELDRAVKRARMLAMLPFSSNN